jgi:hypothetical protein
VLLMVCVLLRLVVWLIEPVVPLLVAVFVAVVAYSWLLRRY